MKKHILLTAFLAGIAVPAAAKDNTLRIPFVTQLGEHEPPVIEIDVGLLKALVASAEENGDKTAFIGNPIVWSTDGKVSKPGAYLTSGGSLVVQSGKNQ